MIFTGGTLEAIREHPPGSALRNTRLSVNGSPPGSGALRVYSQRFELAVEIGPFHAGLFRHPADVAAERVNLTQEILPFELLARRLERYICVFGVRFLGERRCDPSADSTSVWSMSARFPG